MQPRRVATIIMYLGGTGADSAELSGGHTIFPCLRTQGGGAPLLGAAECAAIGELFADGVHVATALRLRLQSNRSQFMTIIVYDGMRRRGAPLLRLLSRLSVPLLQLSLLFSKRPTGKREIVAGHNLTAAVDASCSRRGGVRAVCVMRREHAASVQRTIGSKSDARRTIRAAVSMVLRFARRAGYATCSRALNIVMPSIGCCA